MNVRVKGLARASLWQPPRKSVALQQQQMAFPRKLLSVTTSDFVFLAESDGGSIQALPVDAAAIIAGEGSTFVLRPADPLGARANVYLDWPTLIAAMNAVQGPKFVEVDTTFGPAHVVAGGPYNIDQCVFQGETTSTILNFDVGSTVTFDLLILESITFKQNGNAPAATFGPNSMVVIRDGSTIQSSTSSPWGTGPSSETACFVAVYGGSAIGEGTNPVFAGTINYVVTLAGASVCQANALSGAATVSKSSDSTFIGPQGASVNLAISSNDVIVFQPGGTPGPNTYTTWAAAYAAINAKPGLKIVMFDDSAGACHITAGGPYNLDNCFFVSQGTALSGFVNVTIDQGATASALNFYAQNIKLVNASTNPFFTDGVVIYLDGAFIASAVGAGAFMNVVSRTGVVNGTGFAQIGITSSNVTITAQAGQTCSIDLMGGSILHSSSLGGAGTFILQYGAETLNVSFSQPGITGTFTLTPQVVPNQQTSNTVTGGGTAAVTVGPTPSVARLKTGKVLVSVTASVLTANAGFITTALNGSVSGTIANGNQQVVAGGDPVLITLVAPDTVTTAGQTYSLSLASGGGAGNITVVGTPVISAFEI